MYKKAEKMIKAMLMLVVAITVAGGLSGCGSSKNTLTMVWFPDESGEGMEDARQAIGEYIEQATGKKVKHQTTTDYSVAVEALANNKANLSFLGSRSYIEASQKNNAIDPIVVYSGASGSLEDAKYYSWIAVLDDNADEYKEGDSYSLDNIKGKKMSFVSNSSTSGFLMPTTLIKKNFSGVTEDDLIEGGDDKFFSEVLYGGSHQGSCINLLSGKADVAAMCDTNLEEDLDLVEGEPSTPGAVYQVKSGLGAPFDQYAGQRIRILATAPVLNEPIVVNHKNTSDEDAQAIQEALTSDEVANNSRIFYESGSDKSGLREKKGNTRFVKVDADWYQPMRDLMQ